jgi:ornithine cyclodeaminase
MDLMVLNYDDVREMLSFPECIDLLQTAFLKARGGACVLPPRTPVVISEGKNFGAMAAYVEGLGRVGLKVNTVFSGNSGSRFHIHQGAILVFETENGCLEAIVEAAAVTNIRTAAASALATKLLTEERPLSLAVIGAGAQGSQHLLAMRAARPLRRVAVWDISPERAEAMAAWARAETGLECGVAATPAEAAGASDLICICTPAVTPVLLGEWVKPGTHVNSVGFSGPQGRELDNALMQKSKLYVDWRETIVRDCGDILLPLSEGVISENDILGDLGGLVSGEAPRRVSSDDVTLFKATGVAIEDLACADYLLHKARREGRGNTLKFGGSNI